MDSNNQHLNVTIEYPGTNACRVWYTTTAGAMWPQICAAHVADPEVGSHPFSRVTGIAAGDDGLKPHLSRSTSDLDSISAPDGLRPCSVLQEWAQFCEETIEGAAVEHKCEEDDLTLGQVQAHMPRVWGAADADAVENILRRDRTEQLEEVASRHAARRRLHDRPGDAPVAGGVRPEQVPAATQAVAAAGVFAARIRA